MMMPSVVSAEYEGGHRIRLGAPVDTGRPRVHSRARVRTSREVAGRAIGGLESDLPRPVQLRRVRVPGPFSLPVIEDAGRVLLLPRRFAPVSRGQAAILLPRAAAQLQRAVAVSRDPQKAHSGRLSRAALRQGE